MRTGRHHVHELTPEEVFTQCVTASGIAAIGREINHDAELMVYHHILAELSARIEDAGWDCLDTMKPGHPAEQLFEQILGELQEEDHSFYLDASKLFHCLDDAGMAARLQKLVDCLDSGEPLSPDSAGDAVIAHVIEDSSRYKAAVLANDNDSLMRLVGEISQQLPSEVLSEDKFNEYLCATFAAGEQTPENVSLIEYEDGYMQCDCTFCKPRIQIWEQVREEGEIPALLPLQETLVSLMHVDLRELAVMTDDEGDAEDADEEYYFVLDDDDDDAAVDDPMSEDDDAEYIIVPDEDDEF